MQTGPASLTLAAPLPIGRETLTPQLHHEEALARCEFVIQERRGLGVVTGPAGAGKSQLLRTLQRQGPRWTGALPIFVDLTIADAAGLLRALADGLAIPASTSDTCERWQAIQDRLEGLAACGAWQLVLLDHFDSAAAPVADLVRALLNASADSRSLTVIAAARGPLSAPLQCLLADFGTVRIELGLLQAPETAEYVRTSLQASGRSAVQVPAAALQEMQRISGGQPRRLERLWELALLASTVDGAEEVTAEMIRAASQELAETVAAGT